MFILIPSFVLLTLLHTALPQPTPCSPHHSYNLTISPYCDTTTNTHPFTYPSTCASSLPHYLNNLNIPCYPCPHGTHSIQFNSSHTTCTDNPPLPCSLPLYKTFFPFPNTHTNHTFTFTISNSVHYGSLSFNYFTNNFIPNEPSLSSSILFNLDNSQLNLSVPFSNANLILFPGEHTLTLTHIPLNTIINYITITNTTNGVAYSCIDQPISQQLKLHAYTQNVRCGNEYTTHIINKQSTSCYACTTFTHANAYHSNCILHNAIAIYDKGIIYDFNHINNCTCNRTNTFINDDPFYHTYYLPISYTTTNTNEVFYISKHINLSPIHTDNIKDISDLYKAFAYKVYHNNMKNVNLGYRLNEVKIVNTDNDKGVILRYDNGDTCDTNINETYRSYFYMKCDTNNNYNAVPSAPQLLWYNNCTYYFQQTSKHGCPICTTHNTQRVTSRIVNNKQTVLNYNINNDCVYAYTRYNVDDVQVVHSQQHERVFVSNVSDDELITVYHINMTSENDNYVIYNTSEELLGNVVYDAMFEIEHLDSNGINAGVVCVVVGPYVIIVIVAVFLYLKIQKLMKQHLQYQTIQNEIANVDVIDDDDDNEKDNEVNIEMQTVNEDPNVLELDSSNVI